MIRWFRVWLVFLSPGIWAGSMTVVLADGRSFSTLACTSCTDRSSSTCKGRLSQAGENNMRYWQVWLIDLQGENFLMWYAWLCKSCTIEAPGTLQSREYFIVSAVKKEWVDFTCVISVTDMGGRDWWSIPFKSKLKKLNFSHILENLPLIKMFQYGWNRKNIRKPPPKNVFISAFITLRALHICYVWFLIKSFPQMQNISKLEVP